MSRHPLDNIINLSGEDGERPDSIDVEALKTMPERFLNRELSWIDFNKRVLQEAQNETVPLFERVRYLSIAASNFEEFFMVRVAGLKAQIKAEVSSRSIDGLSPQQQLDAVREKSLLQITELHETWQNLKDEMEEQGVQILKPKDLGKAEYDWLARKFTKGIFPMLSPIAIDPTHPFPFIPNKGVAIALSIADKETKKKYEALIQLPQNVERLIPVQGNKSCYVLLEDVILEFMNVIFPKPLKVGNAAVFRVLRDSEIMIEEEAEDLALTFESALKRRRRGDVIRLTMVKDTAPDIRDFLIQELNIADEDILTVGGIIGLADMHQVIHDEKSEFLFEPFNARFPERIRDFGGDCFAAIRHKDIVVHHPYESFDVVLQFIKQASRDPDVVAIKQTLYRTSPDSPIVKALIEAAESGKSVTAMVELKARFDEEANIRWARDMERAGVQVVYGFFDLKTHAKLSLVMRKEGYKLRTYAHVGTGNYHWQTAKVYTDLSYFTCDPDICHDAALVFNFMTGYAKPTGFRKLAAAPLCLREKIEELIDKEIEFAKKGKPASIWMKCNALLDSRIVDKLYEASQAGVKVDLIVRGICSLRPGIPGLSENIRVKSLVGRFLEHGRIYCFGNGHKMPSRSAKVFISSADMMARNLDRRIELFVPIMNKTVHKQVLDQIMVATLKDQTQSWMLRHDGSYERLPYEGEGFSAHEYFMKNPSLSGRGKSLQKLPAPPRLTLEYSASKK